MSDNKKSPIAASETLARDGEQQDGLGIKSLEGKLERYAGGKNRALRMKEYITLHHSSEKKLIADLHSCASYLVFNHYYTIDELRLVGAITCKKHLLCPFCAMRRASKYLRVYLEKIDYLHSQGFISSDLKPYFVTLTVKDKESLKEAFTGLKNAFCRYTQQRRDVLKGKKFCEFAKASGGVYSYEVKRGKGSGLWHPHLHMIWWCKTPPDKLKLSQEWHLLTGDSYIVDVRPLTAREGQSSLVAGFIEVFKYALKFSEMDESDNWEAFKFLSGKRLVSSFGFLRGLQIPESLLDDEIENMPYFRLFYSYYSGGYYLSNREEICGD